MSIFKTVFPFFFTPNAEQVAKSQLFQAKRDLLKQHEAFEYHEAMVTYLQTKIRRLEDANLINTQPESYVMRKFKAAA